MTPEQQKALALARARRRRQEAQGASEATDERDSILGKVDAAMRGAADTLSFGLADEIAAGGDALFNPVFGTGKDGVSLAERYNANLDTQRGIDEADDEKRAGYRLGGQIAGGVAGGVGLAKSGLSLSANAVQRGASLGRVAGASALEGGVLGAAHGAGSGEGLEGRLSSAGVGAGTGFALGGLTPLAVAGVQKLGGMATAPITARLFPERYSQRAIGEGLRRSGMTVDDVAAALARSQADDQGMFTVADAMGNSGQRMLSTVARNPSDARQAVVEALQARQVGQGDRLSSFLAEGFDASDTAAQREAALSATRTATANSNYAAARKGAGAVNLNNAIGEIDNLLGRDPILGETALSTGPLGTRLRALRDQISRGGEQLIDFDRVLNIKSDLYQQMQRNPQVASDMRGVYGLLDKALETASSGYRAANDTFRQQSSAIDAVDLGRNAASGRMRSADTVQQFGRLSPDEQAAFRAGYVDPLISRIESSSMSPTTNKARALITSKTGEEFPAFAAEGRADQLGNRIAREQRMFETANHALGGSRTADNFADAADQARFDPGIMAKMFRGDIIGALADGARRVGSETSGTPPRVIEQIAAALMESTPDGARRLLDQGARRTSQADQLRARIVSALIGSGAAGAGRLASP